MRHRDDWHAARVAMVQGQLRGYLMGTHLSIGSRIAADLVAPQYAVMLKERARGRLVDLGCGNVPLFGVYRDLVDEVYCVDWPASRNQQSHIDVFADLTRQLPFRNSSFDTVVLSDVLEHIPNPEILTTEIARILRPGGCTIIGVPFLYGIHEIPNDYNRYTRYQLDRLIKNAGLEVVQIIEIGGSPEVSADIMSSTLAHRRWLVWIFVVVAKWLLRCRVVKKISERTRSVLPIAYVAVGKKL